MLQGQEKAICGGGKERSPIIRDGYNQALHSSAENSPA